MEISNFEENIPEENKKQKLILNLAILKNKYKALNNFEFPKNELLLQIDSYTHLIQKITINLNITSVQLYLNSLDNISSYLNTNLPKKFEEKNSFYKEYNEFINSIINKIYILNKIKNDIAKNKSKVINLKKICEENKELNLTMNINNINSIKDCFTNPIFIKYTNEEIYNNIDNANKLFNDYEKFFSRNNQNINEIYNINKEFTNEIKKCSLIFKDMKNKYFCNKYMKNTGNNTFKIHNSIFNGYIKIFFDYFLKLSQFVIKKISEENLKLQRINFNKSKNINKEKEKDIINNIINEDFNQIKINNIHQNKKDELNSIINEGFKYAFGRIEKFEKTNINKNVLNLDAEFCFEKYIINNNKNKNNDMFNEEQRKKDYQNLFNFNQKLSELNKDNNEIIINLIQIENGFNYRNKELVEKKNLLNEKYIQIIKRNNNGDLIKEKKFLENEYNSIKLQEQEIELNLDALKMKFQKNISNNKNIKLLNKEKKNEEININEKNKEEQKEKEVIINNNNENKEKEKEKEIKENVEEKQKNVMEKNKKKLLIQILMKNQKK